MSGLVESSQGWVGAAALCLAVELGRYHTPNSKYVLTEIVRLDGKSQGPLSRIREDDVRATY
jgi:hypothetical protein